SIDPITGTTTPSMFFGSEPGNLVISSDEQYLYASLDGAGAIRRFNLATQTPGFQFSLGNEPTSGQYFASDFDVQPGNPDVIAVSRMLPSGSPSFAGVAIFDGGVKRPVTTPGQIGSSLVEFSNSPSVLYGGGDGLRTMTVTANGVTTSNPFQVPTMGANIRF